MHIGMTQEIPEEYAKALDQATTLDSLRSTVRLYAEIARDAVEIVEKMDSDGFDEWRLALKRERKGNFMGEELAKRFGALLMPEVMMKVAMVASQYHVPFGLTYNRLRDLGKLKIGKDRTAVLDF